MEHLEHIPENEIATESVLFDKQLNTPGCSFWPENKVLVDNTGNSTIYPEHIGSSKSVEDCSVNYNDMKKITQVAYKESLYGVGLEGIQPLHPMVDVSEDFNNADYMESFNSVELEDTNPLHISDSNKKYSLPQNNEYCCPPKELTLSGRRIFDVAHLFNEMKRMSKHNSLFECSFANMVLVTEEKKGFLSRYTFQCNMCGFKEILHSENTNKKAKDVNINTACVNGMMMTGQSFSALREISAALDIPCMSKDTFTRHSNKLSSVIHDVAWMKMKEAAKQEADLAIAAGDVDDDGIPYITVVVDGAWCKRSYKSNYSALSGVVSKGIQHV